MEHPEEVSTVTSSEYRIRVLTVLNRGPQTPSDIAEATDFRTTHASRALRELGGGLDDLDDPLVELIVPEDRKKGRLYDITEKGEDVLDEVERYMETRA